MSYFCAYIELILSFTSSDGHDLVLHFVPYLTYASPHTNIILSFALVSFLAMVPIVNMLPMRTTFLVLGLLPFFITHPFTQQSLLPVLQSGLGPHVIALRARLFRLIDDDNLDDKHWGTELREVELYENERWVPGTNTAADEKARTDGAGSWSKTSLKPAERKAWTRGRDGWSGVADDGSHEVR